MEMTTETVVRAATVIEQRPSGHHYERWTVRLYHGAWCGLVGYTLKIGGLDGIWYGSDEEAAMLSFDRAVRTD